MKEIFSKTHPLPMQLITVGIFLICLKHKYHPKEGKFHFHQLHGSHLIALMDSLKESAQVIVSKSWTL